MFPPYNGSLLVPHGHFCMFRHVWMLEVNNIIINLLINHWLSIDNLIMNTFVQRFFENNAFVINNGLLKFKSMNGLAN